MIKSFFSNMKNAPAKVRNMRIIVFLGIAGMALILFSDLFQHDSNDSHTDTVKNDNSDISGTYDSYVSDMENRLGTILENIDGVGKAKVMLTSGSTEEYIYAEEEKTNKSEDSVSKESQYVIVGSGSNKEALIKKVINPEIGGVVIVCEGGDSNVVREQIYKAVSAAFNLPAGRIFVSKLTQ